MTLVVEGLQKTYSGGTVALRGVTLTISRGLFGLLGPNGAGKSTFMRILATLQLPDDGAVTFHGLDVLRDPNALRLHLGYLPQEFGVYPGISAQELLDHIALLKNVTNRRLRREQVENVLELTNLSAHRKRPVSGFSGGMRQRFGIAQALLGDPKLLIVDEPTTGLDPEERNRFHGLLCEISEDMIVLLSTHIVEDVRQLCPNLAILAGGCLKYQGAADDLIDSLSGRVWHREAERTEIVELRKRYQVLSTQFTAGLIRVRILSDANPEEGFSRAVPNLEDAYFATLFETPAP